MLSQQWRGLISAGRLALAGGCDTGEHGVAAENYYGCHLTSPRFPYLRPPRVRMETANTTQQFTVCSQVRMHGHRPTTAQWEPQESDPIAANGLYRRENNVPGSKGLHTVAGAGQNLLEGRLRIPASASTLSPRDAGKPGCWPLRRASTGRCYRQSRGEETQLSTMKCPEE